MKTNIILFGDNKDDHQDCEAEFNVTIRDIINFVEYENVPELTQCLKKIAEGGCLVKGKTGCTTTKIENVPYTLAVECKHIIENSELASQLFQTSVLKAANLPSNIAVDTYAVELSDLPSENKRFDYNEQLSNILLYETSSFNHKNCFNICRIISKCIGIMRDEAWYLEGRFMLLGLSPQLNPIRLISAISNDDSIEMFGEWKKEFCAQIIDTPLMHLFDSSNDTLNSRNGKYYYVAFIFGAEFIPKVVHSIETIFRKLKIDLVKQADLYVYPYLKNLTKHDEELQKTIFEGRSFPLDEDSWVSCCLSPDLNEKDLSHFLENRRQLLEAIFILLSTRTRSRDPNYGKYVCLSDPFDNSELVTYQTKDEANEAAGMINYYPPVFFIGQIGIDFVHRETLPEATSDIFYISSYHPQYHTMPYFDQIYFGSANPRRLENAFIAYDTGNPHTVLFNNPRLAIALTQELSNNGSKEYQTCTKIGDHSGPKRIQLGHTIILNSDRGVNHANDIFILLGINYLVQMNHGIIGNSSGKFIIAPYSVIDHLFDQIKLGSPTASSETTSESNG